MKIDRLISEERGYTIQELLVVLIVGSLLVGFGYSIFLFTGKIKSSWQTNTTLRSTVHRIMNQITWDIQQSKNIVELSDSILILTKKSGEQVKYRFQDSQLHRGNDEMYSAEGAKINVQITRANPNDVDKQNQLLDIKIDGQSKSMDYKIQNVVLLPYSSEEWFNRTSKEIQ
jgi:hypothetical protein